MSDFSKTREMSNQSHTATSHEFNVPSMATKQNKFPDSNKGFQEVILEDDEMTEKVNHLEYLKMPCYKLNKS